MYLIIGASSFIGQHLYNYCKQNKIDVLGTYFTHSYNTEWFRFDICTDDLREVCDVHATGKHLDAVIICGANTSIDTCKKNECSSFRLNVNGTERILKQADEMGIKSVFLSSEAVFDGNQGMYSEVDIPHPITCYGSQKWQVEQYIVSHLSNYLIFRISRAVGSSYGEKDIFGEFYNKIINQKEIVCLKNQKFCITDVNDISKGIVTALKQGLRGLYHLSSANYISRFELAKFYAGYVFGGYDKIVEKEYSEIPFIDNRHIYGGLDGGKLVRLLDIRYMDTPQILNKYMNTYQKYIFKEGHNNDRSME